MFEAGTDPWLNTSNVKVIVSPGYTLASSPAAKVFLNAKSKISNSNSSKSASSSSPPPLLISSLTSVSLESSVSSTESISSGLSPKSSVEAAISALFTRVPAVAAASTVKEA